MNQHIKSTREKQQEDAENASFDRAYNKWQLKEQERERERAFPRTPSAPRHSSRPRSSRLKDLKENNLLANKSDSRFPVRH